MSNLRLNLRILMWHFQVAGNWKISVTYNDYHRGLKYGWFALPEYKNFFKQSGYFSQDKKGN